MSSKRWKFLLPEVLIGAIRKIGMVCLMWFSLGEPSWAIDPDPNPEPNDCVNDVVGSIQGSPADLLFGQSATVNWSVSRPSNCPAVLKLGPDQFNETLISPSGSRVVTPGYLGTHVWYVRATYAGLSRIVASTALRVGCRPLPSDTIVRIEGSDASWRCLLVQALEAGNKTIVLSPDVDMPWFNDTVRVKPNTILTSNPNYPNPATAVRTPTSLGPAIRTDASGRPKPLFLVSCEVAQAGPVVFDGFRLIGPHWNPVTGDENKRVTGIYVRSCDNVKITNMEIAGWSGQGVYVKDPDNVNSVPSQVQVTDSYIHHNQFEDGYGYGVESTDGAQVLIERNVFNFNRHAIAGGGADGGSFAFGVNGTGYTARNNLVLRGGGYHQNEATGKVWQTHQFDMHGTESCIEIHLSFGIFGSIEIAELYHSGCGQAGRNLLYVNNAFQYRTGTAIKLRGRSYLSSVMLENVFPRSESESMVQNRGPSTFPPMQKVNNTVNYDTAGKYGVCDINGDGTDDLFLATGVNWWWSPGGKMPWSFLRQDYARLEDVGLGDFDGDGRCDVLTGNPFRISRGARADWQEMPGGHGADMQSLRFADFNGDGRTDIFRRDPEGRWFIVSPGVFDWTEINNSVVPLSELRLGDFNGDRVADVVAPVGGNWKVSYGGVTAWQQLNRIRGESLRNYVIGDINGNGIDDVLRYRFLVRQSALPSGSPPGLGDKGIWEVTWDGRGTNWIALNTYTSPGNENMNVPVPGFVGRFENNDGQVQKRLLIAPPAATYEFGLLSRRYRGRTLNVSTGALEFHGDVQY
ncbi:MAG: VCBS repeat-containing protein [Rhodanobacteraceae bacterium]|nr:VCBS repeat-containing protein [Rhodanobacteraceae bacterium]